ncbi:hypothetical protein AB4Y43_01540 [Paraburkholderia sp. BR10872]|uniref:hypothetical protein n=1 Tax=Paraburkholderia sp. BR10872 TaxID=3236989 RepID=UPI0034D15B33
MAAIQYTPGQRFNRLSYVRETPSSDSKRHAIFRCDCGNEIDLRISSVTSGNTSSCGCLKREESAKNARKDMEPGAAFDRLTFLSHLERKRKHLWLGLFRCACGREIEKEITQVRQGAVRSCGCLKIDRTVEASTKHGMSKTAYYGVWLTMIRRCTDPANDKYKDYGARGIGVCERWMKFENFLADMGKRPAGASIDRQDNDIGYQPGNCRWATPTQQANNTRKNVFIERHGRRQTVAQWARELGLNETTIHRRLKRGWTPEMTLEPVSP